MAGTEGTVVGMACVKMAEKTGELIVGMTGAKIDR
jgi:hypothetical protein